MAKVLLRDLNKKYDEVHAVKNVNLEIRDREFVVLVGPSGCGKTTTLRMVAGLEEISSGEISIDGRVVNDLAPMDRDIAMVFQNYALYPHMSVYDKPLSNLDAALRVQMRVELKRLHDRLETTAIYVTHDQVEAMTLGDRVVVMKDGVVQQEGEPLELYGRPVNRFVASFIGSPAMNFVEVAIMPADGGLWADAAGLRIKIPSRKQAALQRHAGRRVVLGVRPEALRVASGADPAEYAFDTAVEVVEPLGNEILLDVRAGAHAMVARVDPATRLKVHEKVRLAFDPERLHFFDPGSEAAI